MLKFLLSFKTHRFLKTGLLLDYFLKKIAFNIINFIIVHFSYFFNEKFIIEYLFFTIFQNTLFATKNWLTSTKFISTYLIYLNVLIIILTAVFYFSLIL